MLQLHQDPDSNHPRHARIRRRGLGPGSTAPALTLNGHGKDTYIKSGGNIHEVWRAKTIVK